MPASRLSCPLGEACKLGEGDEAGATWKTPDHLATIDQTQQNLNTHLEGHKIMLQMQQGPRSDPQTQRIKVKEIPRPEVGENCTEADWRFFVSKWERYKRSCLSEAQASLVTDQLISCCSSSLEGSMFRKHGKLDNKSETLVFSLMKSMAVKHQNTLVNVVTFLTTGQDTGESCKHFTARLQGLASVCDFVLPTGENDFTEVMVRNQLIRVLADPEI